MRCVPNSVIGWVQAKRGIQHRIEVLDAADRLEHRPDVIQHRKMAIEVGPNVIEETIRLRGPSLDHGMVRGKCMGFQLLKCPRISRRPRPDALVHLHDRYRGWFRTLGPTLDRTWKRGLLQCEIQVLQWGPASSTVN